MLLRESNRTIYFWHIVFHYSFVLGHGTKSYGKWLWWHCACIVTVKVTMLSVICNLISHYANPFCIILCLEKTFLLGKWLTIHDLLCCIQSDYWCHCRKLQYLIHGFLLTLMIGNNKISKNMKINICIWCKRLFCLNFLSILSQMGKCNIKKQSTINTGVDEWPQST